MAEQAYHLYVRAFPDRGAACAVGVVLTRDGIDASRTQVYPVQAPHTHRATLDGIRQALDWLTVHGRPAPVVVHTNLSSVCTTLLGAGEVLDSRQLVEDLRRHLAERRGSTVVWTGNREGNPHMERAFALARGTRG